MNEHEPKRPGNDEKVDELRDRLVDRALAEVLGDDSPPDLSAPILAAVELERFTLLEPQERESTMSKPEVASGRSFARYATVACVFMLLGGGIVLLALPAVQRVRESTRNETPAVDNQQRSEEKSYTYTEQPLGNRRYGNGETSESPDRAGNNKPVTTPNSKDGGWAGDGEGRGERGAGEKNHGQSNRGQSPNRDGTTIQLPTFPDDLNRNVHRNERDGKPGDKQTQPTPPAKPQPTAPREPTPDQSKQSESGKKVDRSNDDLQRDPSARPAKGKASLAETVQSLKSETESLKSATVVERKLRSEIARREDGEVLAPAFEWKGVPEEPAPINEGRDRYERIIENAFKTVAEHPLSTFSVDVDTASYSNTRQYLMQSHRLPPADAVRIEELVNYFDYGYEGPKGDDPFASHIEIASCPWQPKHRLVRVALKGQEIHRKEQRPESNLVFLVDVSGSMNEANKLPLVKEGLKLLTKELGEKDRVAMVVYAGAAGLVLDSTVGYEKDTILAAIDRLNAGGSTAGGAGIKLAYQTAIDNYIRGGTNRVILCSDGDFNVGVSSTAELEKLAEKHAQTGVFLSVMGFGRGNLNDAMMERITNKGNGNYAYIDSIRESQKVFVEQMSGTLVTIAKDVKIQIEFNPTTVAGYRLIGYENRMLAKEDFNDDTKDAGEIGAGHTVTALYEVVPAGEKLPTPGVDELKYQKPTTTTEAAKSGEMLTLKLRYKQPTGETSKLLEFPVKDAGKTADEASGDFKFAASVASFGMLLRGSKFAGTADYDTVLELATSGKGDDKHGYRAELIEMVKQAKKVDKRQ